MANFSANEATCRKEKMTWGSALVNHTYKTLNASNFIACVLECDEESQCRSCNFRWNKLECELNYAATYSAATSFIREVNCVHRDMDWEPGMNGNWPKSVWWLFLNYLSDNDANSCPRALKKHSATYKCILGVSAISLQCPASNTVRSAWCFVLLRALHLSCSRSIIYLLTLLNASLRARVCTYIAFVSFWMTHNYIYLDCRNLIWLIKFQQLSGELESRVLVWTVQYFCQYTESVFDYR